MKKIVIGADHRGFALKEELKKIFSDKYELTDVGTHSTESVDYPDIATLIAKQIQSGKSDRGILICGKAALAHVLPRINLKASALQYATMYFPRIRELKMMT